MTSVSSTSLKVMVDFPGYSFILLRLYVKMLDFSSTTLMATLEPYTVTPPVALEPAVALLMTLIW